MEVHFYATLRSIVGQKTVEIDLPAGATVREMIAEVVSRYPDLRRQLLDENGELYDHMHVFINGRDAPYLEEGMDTQISPEDTVNMFPPVGGG